MGHGFDECTQVKNAQTQWKDVCISRTTYPSTSVFRLYRKEDQEVMDGSGYKIFVWDQPVVMPSYLIALAVGELESREISKR